MSYEYKYHKLGREIHHAMRYWEIYMAGENILTERQKRDLKVMIESYRNILKVMNMIEQEDDYENYTEEQRELWKEGKWIK